MEQVIFATSAVVFAGAAGYMWYLIKLSVTRFALPKSLVMAFRGWATGPLLLWLSWRQFGWPTLSSEIAWIIFWAVLLNIALAYYTLRAYELNDLGLAVHLRVFGPAASLLVSLWLLGSDGVPSAVGVSGILVLAVGVYFLNLEGGIRGRWLAPFKTMWEQRTSWLWLVLLTTAVMAFMIVFDKELVVTTNRLFAPAATSILAWGLGGLVWSVWDRRAIGGAVAAAPKGALTWLLVRMGGANIVTLLAHGYLYSYGYASSAGAVRRMESLAAVIFGWWLLKEKGLRYRLFGTVLIIAGAVLVSLDLP